MDCILLYGLLDIEYRVRMIFVDRSLSRYHNPRVSYTIHYSAISLTDAQLLRHIKDAIRRNLLSTYDERSRAFCLLATYRRSFPTTVQEAM